MARGEKLRPAVIHATLKLNGKHYSVKRIGKTVNKSRGVTMNVPKGSYNHGKRKSGQSNSIWRQIAEKAKVTITVNARRLLKNREQLKRRELQSKM